MLEIVICGGDTACNGLLNNLIEEYLLSNQVDFRISIFICKNDLQKSMEKGFRFHIILLDILLPDANGIVLSRLIRRYDRDCIIILISITTEYAIHGYSVHAFDYLVKPLQKNTVIRTITDAADRCGVRLHNTITIRAKGVAVSVKCSNIVFIESVKHYLKFHTINGGQYQTYGKLDEYEKALAACRSYLRCHQSFLINMDHVKDVSGRDFVMNDDTKIPMRKSCAAKIRRYYYRYNIERSF